MLVMIAGALAAKRRKNCQLSAGWFYPMSPAMFANRISGFYMDDELSERREPSAGSDRASFAPLPIFAIPGGNMAGPPEIYRLAYEEAQRQVAHRRERERHMHEWN